MVAGAVFEQYWRGIPARHCPQHLEESAGGTASLLLHHNWPHSGQGEAAGPREPAGHSLWYVHNVNHNPGISSHASDSCHWFLLMIFENLH